MKKLVLAGVVATVFIVVLIQSQRTREPLKVSGFIEADEIRLGSRVGGRVRVVHIAEGDDVEPNQLLIELEPFDFLERRAEADARREEKMALYRKLKAGYREEEIDAAEARYRQLQAELKKLEEGPRQQEIDTAKAELEVASAQLELERKQHERVKGLFEKGTITRSDLDRADAEFDSAVASVQARQEQFDLLKAGTREEDLASAKARLDEAEAEWKLRQTGFRQEDVDQAYAAMQAGEHAVAIIDQQIAELKVVSPVIGTVQTLDLQPGDLINANAPVLSLLDTSHLWIRAYVPENQLDLKLKQKVKITVDSYPNESFTGEISFIAKQAEFTPRNVQTPEERSKQVFRIKVTLLGGLDRLRPGMGADVWLEP